MPVRKFQPANYADYSDYGGFKTFTESYNNAKNLAIEALNKKKGEFMKDELDRLEMNMFPPDNVKMIMTDPKTGAKRLNKGFYAIMNKTPEKAYREARKRAEAAGLGKHGLNRTEYMNAWQDMQKSAVQRQYQKLATYGAKNGSHSLQNILEKEGGQFNAFYQRHSDPYIQSLNLSNTTSLRKRPVNTDRQGWTTGNRNGVKMVTDIPFYHQMKPEFWGVQGSEVFVDDNGVEGVYNLSSQFIPLNASKSDHLLKHNYNPLINWVYNKEKELGLTKTK